MNDTFSRINDDNVIFFKRKSLHYVKLKMRLHNTLSQTGGTLFSQGIEHNGCLYSKAHNVKCLNDSI